LVLLREPTEASAGMRANICQKTQMCRYYRMKGCKKGCECPFAHGRDELRDVPDLRKTSLCWAWQRNACPLEAAVCQYAHGVNDLRRTQLVGQAPPATYRRGPQGGHADAGVPPTTPAAASWATPEQSQDMQLEKFMRQLSTDSEESAATLELMLHQAVPDHYEDRSMRGRSSEPLATRKERDQNYGGDV